jgi:hypothetical protein
VGKLFYQHTSGSKRQHPIDFEQANDSERNAYMGRVANRLLLGDLELAGNLSAMQDTLEAALAKEFTLQEIQVDLSWGQSTFGRRLTL